MHLAPLFVLGSGRRGNGQMAKCAAANWPFRMARSMREREAAAAVCSGRDAIAGEVPVAETANWPSVLRPIGRFMADGGAARCS